MHSFARYILLLVTLLLSVSVPTSLQAQPQIDGSFRSERPIVGPLEPVTILVTIPGYTGPATLVIFEPSGDAVGTWEFQTINGVARITVTPRGGLGEQWGALFASGVPVAQDVIYQLEANTTVQTGVPDIDLLYPRAQAFMLGARLGYELDGVYIHGYRSPDSALLWLRDHYYQGRGFAYFDSDVTSLLDAFEREQQPDGSLPDFVARPDWNIEAMRTPVEADVEYLYVQAVYEAWQMTGDDAWLRGKLPSMQAALNYTLSDPLRWEPNLGLVKRPFTIDTWDFEYGPTTTDPSTGAPAPRHWIDEQTKWGIFHGDNTGMAEALRSLAAVEDYFGQPANADYHRRMADAIMGRLNALSWNGRFFTHHVKLVPYDVPGVNEAEQLSLSNAIALNRGVLTTGQGQAIVGEYLRRLNRNSHIAAFGEWWSIDPPFPEGSFGLAGRKGERPGEYVNGGVMPLVGGELARGAFRYGYERYGFNILDRYVALINATNATFLWYYPTGAPGIGSPETIPTDGWGASAMIGALMEGAAGIEDQGVRYSDVTLSPRWPAHDQVQQAYVVARYAASDGYVAYRWRHSRERGIEVLTLAATGSGEQLRMRLLLPNDTKQVSAIYLNGQPVPPRTALVGESLYALVDAPADIVEVRVEFKR